jgi:hypothetical protein
MATFGACAAPPVQAHHSALAVRGASHSDEPRLQGELGGVVHWHRDLATARKYRRQPGMAGEAGRAEPQDRRNDLCLYMNDDLYIFKKGERYGGEAKGYVAGSDMLDRVWPTWPKFQPSLPRGLEDESE